MYHCRYCGESVTATGVEGVWSSNATLECECPARTDGGDHEGIRKIAGIHSCVPMLSPDGGHVLRVEEDSSARYTDGWVIDAESDRFYRP